MLSLYFWDLNLSKETILKIGVSIWRAFEPSSLVLSWRIHGVLKWRQQSHLGASTLLVARISIIHPSSWAILLSFLSSLLIHSSSLLSCCFGSAVLVFQHLFFCSLPLISLCSVQFAYHPFPFGVFLMAFSWSSSWINVEYGAEAMNESGQDPPKSSVDLVGAW